jgi:hypothetical protein
MTNKFKYPIFPDRLYTLTYDDMSTEVLGQDILNMFYRTTFLDKIIEDMVKDTSEDDLDTPKF